MSSFVFLTLLLLTGGFLIPVFAQYETTTAAPTPEQLEECKKLGIRPEECSEHAILAKTRCLGGPGAPCGDSSPTYAIIDLFWLSIFVGLAVALVVGVMYVKRTRDRDRKKEKQGTESQI